MRLLKELPEIEPALKTGELSLSNASALQHFFKGEKKDRGKTYSHTAKKELVAKVTGKSRRDCDRLLAELAPETPRPEQARPISATQTEIRFTAEETLLAKIEKLKALLSHRNPNPSYAELIEMLADMALKRLDPEQKADATPEQKGEPKPEENLAETRAATPPAESIKRVAKQTRHIPQNLRRTVWKRDQGRCAYVNKETGVRCDSKYLLQIHHLKDFSLGGKHTLDNLTLRYIYQGSEMTLTGATTFNGTIFHDDLSRVVLKSASAPVQPMASSDLILREQLIQLAAVADGLPATQSLDPASPEAVDLMKGAEIYGDPNVRVNVISARHILVPSGQSLSFHGNENTVFVLKISGMAEFGNGIALSGVLPSHVLIYVGASDSSAPVSIGGSSGVAGTFLSLQRSFNFSGQGSFRGAVISGSSSAPAISLGGNGAGLVADFEADPFCPGITSR